MTHHKFCLHQKGKQTHTLQATQPISPQSSRNFGLWAGRHGARADCLRGPVPHDGPQPGGRPARRADGARSQRTLLRQRHRGVRTGCSRGARGAPRRCLLRPARAGADHDGSRRHVCPRRSGSTSERLADLAAQLSCARDPHLRRQAAGQRRCHRCRRRRGRLLVAGAAAGGDEHVRAGTRLACHRLATRPTARLPAPPSH